jgi:hypothetical protein
VPVLRLSAECCCGCAAWGSVPSCFDWSGRNSARIARAWLGLRRSPRLCAFCHSLLVRWICSSSRCRSPVIQQGWVYRIKSKRRNFPVLSMEAVYYATGGCPDSDPKLQYQQGWGYRIVEWDGILLYQVLKAVYYATGGYPDSDPKLQCQSMNQLCERKNLKRKFSLLLCAKI